jgi:hypothetical protein
MAQDRGTIGEPPKKSGRILSLARQIAPGTSRFNLEAQALF